jgi:hypothetical protein
MDVVVIPAPVPVRPRMRKAEVKRLFADAKVFKHYKV